MDSPAIYKQRPYCGKGGQITQKCTGYAVQQYEVKGIATEFVQFYVQN